MIYLVSGPTTLGLWSIYHHVGDAQLLQVQPSCTWKTGVATTWFAKATWGRSARHDFTRLSGVWESEVPVRLGGWFATERIFYRRCWHPKKVPRYCISVFKDELINSGNPLKQFPANPCIFIAFFAWKTMTCRKGRIAEYIREMDDLVENFGPGWGFGGVEQAMCFLSVFLFWWGPTYTFGFWGNSRFLDVLLGSVI